MDNDMKQRAFAAGMYMAYISVYKDKANKCLMNNKDYVDLRKRFSMEYRALYGLFDTLCKQTENFTEGENKSDIAAILGDMGRDCIILIKQMCADMRTIADMESAELIGIIREEYGD